MATAAIEPAAGATPAAGGFAHDRFPWKLVLLVWLGFSIVLLVRFWHNIVTLDFGDADDLMRLLQVRDLLGGQSWFDMTQYRLDPPAGLPFHWSRLVDLPLAAIIGTLTPLIGRTGAEMIAVTVVPLATLGVTMAAVVAAARRTVGRDALFVLLAPAVLVTSPATLAQMFPTRIDHHGWQIALAAIAFAALLDPRERRSGLIAGAAVALQMSVSLEGLPYAVAAAGSLAVLWLFDRDGSERLVAFMVALAVVSIVSFVTTAPTLRWTTGLCDVVKPAHLLAFAVGAAAITLAARFAAGQGFVARAAVLGAAALVSAAAFAFAAPNCLGSPFGQMDPLVHRFWYDNVLEGVGVMSQPWSGAVTMVVFPLIGLAGAGVGLVRADTGEMRRRWLLVLLLGVTTFLAGLAVRRAAGLSHVVAVPGALMLFDLARRRIETIASPLRRVPLTVGVVLLLSPAFPVGVVAMVAPEQEVPSQTPAPPGDCGWRCDIAAIGHLPASTFFTELDDAPHLIAYTHHKAYTAGYHRLERPMHDTIAAFIGDEKTARGLICTGRFGYLLIEPDSGETHIYRQAARDDFMGRLVRGDVPNWLTRIPLPSGQLWLYRVAPGPSCRG